MRVVNTFTMNIRNQWKILINHVFWSDLPVHLSPQCTSRSEQESLLAAHFLSLLLYWQHRDSVSKDVCLSTCEGYFLGGYTPCYNTNDVDSVSWLRRSYFPTLISMMNGSNCSAVRRKLVVTTSNTPDFSSNLLL